MMAFIPNRRKNVFRELSSENDISMVYCFRYDIRLSQ
jgi:hypothetical protein